MPQEELGNRSSLYGKWTHIKPDQDICADCQKIDVGSIADFIERCDGLEDNENANQDWPANLPIELSPVPLETMRERKSCRICQTFVQLANTSSQNYLSTWDSEPLIATEDEWRKPSGIIIGTLHYRRHSGPVLTLGPDMALSIGEFLLEKCADRIASFEGQSAEDFSALWFQGTPERNQHPDTLYTTSIQLPVIRAWLEACNKRHRIGRNPRARLRKRQVAVDLVLIDVRELKLVNRKSFEKYYALSYVWGGLSTFRTLKANRKELELEGALDSRNATLPTVVREAMELVRSLGDRFLWVDALCISQDDDDHKHSQISKMDVIYGQAFLTIAATIGDAISGTSLARRPHFPQTLRCGNTQLLPIPRAWGEACFNASKYETRAWALQERSLSRSCLIFTAHQMLMFCQHCGTRNEYAPKDLHSGPWLSQLAWFNKLRGFNSWQEPQVWYWYNLLLANYTSRELSYPSDILNAFSGLAVVLAKTLNGNFVYGLPEPVFDFSLLWTFLENSPVRRRLVDGKHPFPTWSWAGWHGPAVHLHLSSSQQGFTGLPPLESLIDEFYIEDHNNIRLIERRGGSCSIPRSIHPDQQWIPHPVFINQPVLHFKTRALSTSCFTFEQGEIQDCRDPTTSIMAKKERASLLPHVVTIVGDPVPAAPNQWLIELSAARSEIVSNRYWLMLVEWKDPCYERIAIGSVDEDIWKSFEPKVEYIRLA